MAIRHPNSIKRKPNDKLRREHRRRNAGRRYHPLAAQQRRFSMIFWLSRKVHRNGPKTDQRSSHPAIADNAPPAIQFSLATLMVVITITSFYLAFTISAPFHAVVTATICGAMLIGALSLTIALYRGGMDGGVARWTDRILSIASYAFVALIVLAIGAGCIVGVSSFVKSVFGW
jgi:hypothetical protein